MHGVEYPTVLGGNDDRRVQYSRRARRSEAAGIVYRGGRLARMEWGRLVWLVD